MLKAISLTVLLILSQQAHALVDMKNANYSDTWTDIEIPGSGYDLKVTRAYNSRSLFNGIFGFGWCSNFETSLEVSPEGNLKVSQCGDGQETIYSPKSFGSADVAKTVDLILKEEKKQNPSLAEKQIEILRKNLEGDAVARADAAKRLGVQREIKEGAEFFAAGAEGQSVTRKKDHFLLSLNDGSSQRYDLQGRLIQMNDKNGNFLKFVYRGDQMVELVDNNSRKLSFTYDSNKKVKTIDAPGKVKAAYEYKDVVNLASAKNMDGNLFSYDYDDLHNLTMIKFPDGTKKSLTYDKQKDWVTSFRERDGCLETYEYTPSQDDPKNHYTSSVLKKCGERVTNKSKFEFWFKERSDKSGKYLHKVAMDVNSEKSEITYHERFGKPTVMKQNARETTFSYYDNGLVKSKTMGKDVTTFKYDKKFNKVSEVLAGKKKTTFEYDGRGNLVLAKNSGGQSVKLSYDSRGRIVSILDQAKRQVNIEYEERFGKPKFVERLGIGSINVSYKPTGEINKVESKDGPAVAVQVASSFNNLLEVIAPAGIDLGL